MMHKVCFPELQGFNGKSHKTAQCVSVIFPRTLVTKWLDVAEMSTMHWGSIPKAFDKKSYDEFYL